MTDQRPRGDRWAVNHDVRNDPETGETQYRCTKCHNTWVSGPGTICGECQENAERLGNNILLPETE